jgi:hypothetical protein
MTAGEFQAAMMRLRQLSEGAADYIEQIEPAVWAAHAIAKPTYGIRTSNLAEQINAAVADARRHDCVTKIARTILERIATHFQSRRAEASKLRRLYCKEPNKVLQVQATMAARYRVTVAVDNDDGLEAYAREMTSIMARERRVTLANDTYSCSCKLPATHKVPCRHVLAVLNVCDHRERFPIASMSPLYHAAPYRESYQAAAVHIPLTDELTPSDEVIPPLLAFKRNGKRKLPAHEREEAKTKKQKVKRCSGCGSTEHTFRNCPQKNTGGIVPVELQSAGHDLMLQNMNLALLRLRPEELINIGVAATLRALHTSKSLP